MKSDLREAGRQSASIDGVVYSIEGRPLVLCTVTDVSVGGAKLQLIEDHPIPRFFLLALDYDGTNKHLCSKVWQIAGSAGVRFSDGSTK
jgi:hypothetical protein